MHIKHKDTYSRLPGLALSLAVLLAMGVWTQAKAQLPPVHKAGDVEYVSGGIGHDESTAFKQAKHDYPLALTFAVHSDGSASSPYASDVQVVIRNDQDQDILNATSEGPYLLVRLKPGHYRISATYEGKTLSRDVDVGQNGTADIKLMWKRPASGPD